MSYFPIRFPFVPCLALSLFFLSSQLEAKFWWKSTIWETNFEKAAASAKHTGKYILLDFSGSDWCGSCIALDNEVFSKRDFKEYAKAKLVCVLVDFPRGKPLPREQETENSKLAFKYGVNEYPTIIILSPDGKPVAKTGYRAGGVKPYIEHLKTIIYGHKTRTKMAS